MWVHRVGQLFVGFVETVERLRFLSKCRLPFMRFGSTEKDEGWMRDNSNHAWNSYVTDEDRTLFSFFAFSVSLERGFLWAEMPYLKHVRWS